MSQFQLDEESIFDFARQIESLELRAQYLDQACGANSTLKDRVAELLRSHDDERSFLEGPPAELERTVDSSQPCEQPGHTIGRYKLLQRIGEGGFGVVYMAEQAHPVRRKVALKVIKPGMDTKEVVARFEAERQALAMMDHPNIAKVFDGGETESGRPYFVLELVRGEPITQFCDKNKLSMKSRIELFSLVCDAIQHAHQKGVIHRDIKPSNVMVTLHDGRPVPKVIDFGVAKAISQHLTAKTLFTAYGQMVGTPQYMSPEQAEMSGLDIDTRSDIYSLGVLLYELLTGSTPIEPSRLRQTAYAEVLRMICEEEPPRPSRRLSSLGERCTTIAASRQCDAKSLYTTLRGDLDLIAMKALDKDRERRYETAKGLGLDVLRYLRDEPVFACPPTSAYLLRKTLKRHRAAVVFGAIVVGLLIIGMLGTGSGWYQERIARESSVRAEINAQREREHAENLAESLERTLYAADMNNAMTAWKKNDLRQLNDILSRYEDSSLRGWEWHYLSNLHRQARPQSYIETSISPLRVFRVPESDRIITTHSRGNVLSVIDNDHTNPLRFGELQEGTWKFSYADISLDGTKLAHPRADFSTVIIRDTVSLEILREVAVPDEFAAEGRTITAASFSPNGKTIAITVVESGLALYDLDASKFERLIPLTGIGTCEAIEFTADGLNIAVSSDPVTVWNTKQGSKVNELSGHTQEVTSLQFVNDDEWLVTGSRDRNLLVWDYETGEQKNSLGPFDGEVRCLAYDAESMRLTAGLRNRKLKTWTLPDFGEVGELRAFNGLYGLGYISDGQLIYGSFGGGVAVCNSDDLSSPTRVAVGGTSIDIEISGDGEHLISLENPEVESNAEWGNLTISSFRLHDSSGPPPAIPPLPFDPFCIATTRSSDRNLLAVGSKSSSQVCVVDLNREPAELVYLSRIIDTASVSKICFSKDERSVFCGLANGRVMELNLDDAAQNAKYGEGRHAARITAIAHDGEDGYVTGAGDGSLHIWENGRLISNSLGVNNRDANGRGVWIRGLDTYRGSIAFGLFGPTNDGQRIFHIDENMRRRGLYGHTFSIHDVALIEGGRTLVSLGGDRELKIWEVETFEQRLAIREPEIFCSLAVSPDESIIAVGTREGSVFIYRAPR